MSAPLPPLLDGPITIANQQVHVDNLLPNATVTVYANNNQVGSATTINAGAIMVPLTATLHHGQEITAKQLYNGSNPSISASGTSDPSNAIKVTSVPNPLPAPVFASGLTTCSNVVFFGNLVPGASLSVTDGSQTLVHAAAVVLPTQAFVLTGGLTSGDILQAWQSFQSDNSPKTHSLPVSTWTGPLPPPVVTEPLRACQTAIYLSGLIPSSDILIVNGSTESFAASAWNALELEGLTPLVAGTLTVTQGFKNCLRTDSTSVTVPVSSDRPPFPVVSYEPCGDIKQIFVSNLIPGSVLTIKRVVANTSTLVGCMGVSKPTATINLPSGFSATDPNGPVSLWIEVLLCSQNLASPGYTKVTFAPASGPFEKPTLRTPLYACVNTVVLSDTHPGSEIQVFSGSTSTPLCNPIVVTGPELVVLLWSPLVAGEKIFVKQLGCNSNEESTHIEVQSIPTKLPNPVIATPVRPGDATVQVSNLLQGASVTLLVNGISRSQQTAVDSTITMPAGLPALVNGDALEAVQSLCTESSGPGYATATLGEIIVSGVPGSMIQDKTVQLLIGATDSKTGEVLENLPVVVARAFNGKLLPEGPSSSGFTGSSFDYTPGKTDTTAYVLVSDSPGYIPTEVGPVTVTPPPPPPPSISFDNGKVYGKNWPCTQCSVSGTFGWGDVNSGPWTGNIVTGIPITSSPCDNPLGGQSYGLQVSCVSDPSISVSITVNC